jgi:hypothetical protein
MDAILFFFAGLAATAAESFIVLSVVLAVLLESDATPLSVALAELSSLQAASPQVPKTATIKK